MEPGFFPVFLHHSTNRMIADIPPVCLPLGILLIASIIILINL